MSFCWLKLQGYSYFQEKACKMIGKRDKSPQLNIFQVPLVQFIDRIKIDCIRCKGFIKLTNGQAIFVQGVFSDVIFQKIPTFKGSGELVLIGTFKRKENLQIIYDEYCKSSGNNQL